MYCFFSWITSGAGIGCMCIYCMCALFCLIRFNDHWCSSCLFQRVSTEYQYYISFIIKFYPLMSASSVALQCTHYHGVYGVPERPWAILSPQQAHSLIYGSITRHAPKRSNQFAHKTRNFKIFLLFIVQSFGFQFTPSLMRRCVTVHALLNMLI